MNTFYSVVSVRVHDQFSINIELIYHACHSFARNETQCATHIMNITSIINNKRELHDIGLNIGLNEKHFSLM